MTEFPQPNLEEEARLTEQLRLAHQTGQAQSGYSQALDYLERRSLHWKSASSPFLDNFSLCSYYAGYPRETFQVTSYLLDYRALSPHDRRRIAFNRRFCIPTVQDDWIEDPAHIVQAILERPPSPDPQITFTITTCKRTDLFIRTMNTFLGCCQDVHLIDEWLCIDDNTDPAERKAMQMLFPFFLFVWKGPSERGHVSSMNLILEQVRTPYLFHCEDDWQFFSPRPILTDALSVLGSDPSLGQVLVNRNYAEEDSHDDLVGGFHRSLPLDDPNESLQYVLHEYYPPESDQLRQFEAQNPGLHSAYWPHFSLRPSLLRTDALHKVGQFNQTAGYFELEFAHRYFDAGYRSAFFPTVNALHTGRLTRQIGDPSRPNAYVLNRVPQFWREQVFSSPGSSSPGSDSQPVRVKPLGFWCDSRSLCQILDRQSQGNYRWNNLQLTWEDDADLYVIFQRPFPGEYYLPERTVFLQTEALAEQNPQVWGMEWADPDPLRFLHMRLFRDFPNLSDWHIGLTYPDLHDGPPPEKTRLLSAIVSSRYTAPGHIKRVDFLNYLESTPGAPSIDIFGFDNAQGFASYRTSLPDRHKADGLLPYRYTFNAENHFLPNYFTEKILDAILAETLCFYWGCPNLDDYLDPRAFIRLDLDDPPSALHTLQVAIAADEWSRRLPVLRREKHRILDQLQFFPTLERFARERDIPAFIINLDRRPDRWQAVRRQIYPHWRHFTRFPAVDGRNLRLTPSQRRLFSGNQFSDRRAVIGCALSHLALWEQLSQDRRFNQYLILEDDVTFCDNFADQMHRLQAELASKTWDVIFLGAHVWRDRRDPRLYVHHSGELHLSGTLPDWFGGTFAYLLSKSGAQKLIELAWAQGVDRGIDTWFILQSHQLEVLFTRPHLVFSEYLAGDEIGARVDSDIQGDFEKVD